MRRARFVALAIALTFSWLPGRAPLASNPEPVPAPFASDPAAPAVPAPLGARETYVMGAICARCHARPGIGVPLMGDAAEWDERRRQGLEALVAHTIVGLRGMPPLGTCSFCSEDELRRLAASMAGLPLPVATGRPDEPAGSPGDVRP